MCIRYREILYGFHNAWFKRDFFALFPRDIKGIRIDDDDGLALFVSISHGVPGTAGASIPYCENIIGVIDHVPISLVHAVRRVPVSYTHLDVYKRQGYGWCCPDCHEPVWDVDGQCNDRLTPLRERSRSWAIQSCWMESNMPDVYKRQVLFFVYCPLSQ